MSEILGMLVGGLVGIAAGIVILELMYGQGWHGVKDIVSDLLAAFKKGVGR